MLEESNRDETGRWDGGGLFSHQVRGFGLGVMQARAMYYAQKEPRFAAFLTEGRTYGPHGADLVVANSIEHYDDALSRELTERVVQANLEMRRLGFKPYVAPALSSGALSLGSGTARPPIWMGCLWGPETGCSPRGRSRSGCPCRRPCRSV